MIYVWEHSLKSLNTKQHILKKLNKAGMTINKNKCKLNCDKISYLGYQISKDSISPDERLTKKIAERNKKESESFFGINKFL